MNKRRFLAVLSMAAVMGTSGIAMSGCEFTRPAIKLDYNMTGVGLADVSVAYDGTNKIVNLTGSLPEGVTATYTYYKINSDSSLTELVNEYPVNVGKYKIVARFNGDFNKYNNLLDLSAILTITKTNINVVVGANKFKTASGETTLEQTKQFSEKSNGDLYFEYDGKEYVVDVVDSNVTKENYSVSYYTELNADGTVKTSAQTLNNTLKNAGDYLYVLVTTSNNNLEANIIKKVSVEKKVVKINNYAGLTAMVTDCKTKDKVERINYKYVLTSNIDCGNAVWNTPGSAFAEASAFCGEFDGGGYTISNLQITNQSVENINDTNGLHVGFFGYTVNADIHDVTFKNVDINITTFGYTRQDVGGNNINPVYAGIVVARMESDGSNGGETSLKNVTVESCDITVDAYKAYVGSVIGIDHAVSETSARLNLNIKNVTILARNLQNATDRVVVGGITGETQSGDAICYEKCKIENLVLKCWDGNVNNIPNNDVYMGAIVGRINKSASITVKDCVVVDYAGLAITRGQAGSYGYWGNAKYPVQDVLHVENSTHSVTEGQEGVYYLQSGGGATSWMDQN